MDSLFILNIMLIIIMSVFFMKCLAKNVFKSLKFEIKKDEEISNLVFSSSIVF